MNDIEQAKSIDQVESALEAERRAQNCMVDLKNVLERWQCRINPIITISGMGVMPKFEIVPLKKVGIA
jgi:hypothetical protein